MHTAFTHYIPAPYRPTTRDPEREPFSVVLSLCDVFDTRHGHPGIHHTSTALQAAFIGGTWADVYAPRPDLIW